MAWVRPTSYSDPNSRWTDETKAYDSDTTTFAYSTQFILLATGLIIFISTRHLPNVIR